MQINNKPCGCQQLNGVVNVPDNYDGLTQVIVAPKNNTLLYLALGAGAYFLFKRFKK